MGSARADTALVFTGGQPALSQGMSGWVFSTDHTITVTSLGWWDSSDDGLGASHQVGIWNTTGILLVSATVASGTIDPLISDFRFDSTLAGNPTLAPGNY